ncbi:MAG: bifunctional 4-hydroxy-2-oxoglutarate aldolase/2-dehydro-3-deoxy-phosphogluconate aldolase [Pseudomonadota bacterium]
MRSIDEIMRRAPVIPVVSIGDAAGAPALAAALVAGGLPVIEITLRTPAGLSAIEAAAKAQPDAVVGAGTVTNAEELEQVRAAGAQFAVSPGLTESLIAASRDVGLPLLPGVATASEAMRAMEAGFDRLKFFPAESAGGPAGLRGLGGPFPALCFCPTGGVTPENAATYLALDNVVCVGGSWVAPRALIDAGDWAAIERRARAASALSV